MRITTNMMTSTYLGNLNTNLTALDRYNTQLSTGKRINKLSDDPVGVLGSMNARVKLSRIAQYQENVNTAQDRLKQNETALKELNSILQTAYERTLQASSDTLDQSDQTAIAEEIAQLRDQVLTLGNTKVANRYLFGGYNSTQQPFTVDSDGKLLYNNKDISDLAALGDEATQNTTMELGYDLPMVVSMNGTQLMGAGDGNIYNLLNNLQQALRSGSAAEELGKFIEPLQQAQSDVLARTSELGGRSNRLALLENRYQEDELTYTDIKSRVEDVDQAEAIMHYKMAEAVYLFALKVGSNIIQPTLVDYLN